MIEHGYTTQASTIYLRHGKRSFAVLEHSSVSLCDVLFSLHLALPLPELCKVPCYFVVLDIGKKAKEKVLSYSAFCATTPAAIGREKHGDLALSVSA